MPRQPRDMSRVRVKANDVKALLGGADSVIEPEMRQSRKADGEIAHRRISARVCAAMSLSAVLIQMSLSMLLSPFLQRRLKSSYSSAQVGSFCTSVTVSSSGR